MRRIPDIALVTSDHPKTQKKARMKMINLLTQARRFVLSVRGFFGSLAYRPTTTQRRSMNG